jgi:hypothetical protein
MAPGEVVRLESAALRYVIERSVRKNLKFEVETLVVTMAQWQTSAHTLLALIYCRWECRWCPATDAQETKLVVALLSLFLALQSLQC